MVEFWKRWISSYVWINMNYLVLSSLKHYSNIEGPHRTQAATIFQELKTNVVDNMAKVDFYLKFLTFLYVPYTNC